MPEDLDEIAGVAFHEAGHAVVAWSLGVRLHEIVVDVVDGVCKHRSLIDFELDPDVMGAAEWSRAEKNAQIILGGEIAQRKFDYTMKPTDFDGDSDRKEVHELASMLFPDSAFAVGEWIAKMQTRSEQIVSEQWKALEILAYELVSYRRLSGDTATRILERAGRQSTA